MMAEDTTVKELPSPDMRRWAWRFVLLLAAILILVWLRHSWK